MASISQLYISSKYYRAWQKVVVKTLAVDIDGTVTENGMGRIHLEAIWHLRHLTNIGHNVIFVSGRSSVEGYMLAVFGGTTPVAVGENGGCITWGPQKHILLGDIKACRRAYDALRSDLDNIVEKPVFPRMTEVVLERTFDLDRARKVVREKKLDVILSDSLYAFHINSSGTNKGAGLEHIMKMRGIAKEDVIAIGDSETDLSLFSSAGISVALGNAPESIRARADIAVKRSAGDGVVEALEEIFPEL